MDKTKKLTFLEQLEEYLADKQAVEILTDMKDVSGQITIIGIDYVGITYSSERSVKTIAVGQDGTKEPQEHIHIYELEVILKLEDIRAVSKVLKSTIK